MTLVIFRFLLLPLSILAILNSWNPPNKWTGFATKKQTSKEGGTPIQRIPSKKKRLIGKEFKNKNIQEKKSLIIKEIKLDKTERQSEGSLPARYVMFRYTSSTVNSVKGQTTEYQKNTESLAVDQYNNEKTAGKNLGHVSNGRQFDYKTTVDRSKKRRHKRDVKLSDIIAEKPCLERGSCKSQLSRENRFCHCDELCSGFGDCCYNANISRTGGKLYETECLKTTISYGLKVLSGCPASYENKTTVDECHHQRDMIQNIRNGSIPVMSDNGFAYKNEHCALCNNVTQFKYFFVSLDLEHCLFYESIEGLTPLETVALANYYDCSIAFAPPPGTSERECLYQSFPKDGDQKHYDMDWEVHPLCSAFVNPVDKDIDTYYRNVFCAPEEYRLSGKYTCIPEVEMGKRHSPFPLTAMIWFGPKSSQKQQSCSSDEISSLNDEICITGTTYRNVYYTFKKKVLTSSAIDVDMGSILRIFFVIKLITDTHPYSLEVGLMKVKIFSLEDPQIQCEDRQMGNNSMFLNFEIKIYIKKEITKQDVDLFNKEIGDLKWQHSEFSNETKEIRTLLFQTEPNCNTSLVTMTPIREYRYRFGKKYQEILVTFNNESEVPYPTEFCKNIQINTTTYTLNGNKESYMIDLNSWVCFDGKGPKQSAISTKDVDFNFVLVVVTYCGLGLSNICLLTSIAIKKHFLPTFTSPGGNVENVMLSILLSQIAFMVGIGANDNRHVCFVMGVLIHYLIICVYICMTLSVLHIAKTFVSLVDNPAKEITYKTSLRVKMTLLSCIIPASIVIPCVVVDLFFYSTFSIGYTHGRTCFPSDFPANIIVVSAPILLCLLINFICVFAIMISIFRLSGNFRPWYDRLHIPVLMKLFFFTGLPWLFGVLSEFLNNDVLRVAFVLSYSLQGFCVSVAWTCNRRVLRSLRRGNEARTSSSPNQAKDVPATANHEVSSSANGQ